MRFSREMHDGWWRKEFTLPPGKVWRAIGEVSMMCSLFVNGREVPSAGGMVSRPGFNFANGEMFGCEAADLAPFLRAGSNAIAIHVARNGAMPYVNGTFTVVMESGEVLRLATDGSWKHSQAEPLAAGAKVSAAGFDDRAWSAAQARAGLSLNYKQAVARPAYAGLMVIENPAEPYLFFKDTALLELQPLHSVKSHRLNAVLATITIVFAAATDSFSAEAKPSPDADVASIPAGTVSKRSPIMGNTRGRG